MLATSRQAALALRGTLSSPQHPPRATDMTTTVLTLFPLPPPAAQPRTALTPFKVAAASISQSTKKPAQEVAPVRGYGAGNVKGNPGPPPSMKALSKKMDQEVPLASQEGNKSAVQYAL